MSRTLELHIPSVAEMQSLTKEDSLGREDLPPHPIRPVAEHTMGGALRPITRNRVAAKLTRPAEVCETPAKDLHRDKYGAISHSLHLLF